MKTCNLFLMLAAVVCCMCAAACSKDSNTETKPTPVVAPEENTGSATGYQFVPLEQYLPGEWRLDPRCVFVDGDMESGWQRFHNTYTFEAWSPSPLTIEESIIFDTAGNIVFRITGMEDKTSTYYLTGDSTKIGIMGSDGEIYYNNYFLQINADSMAVYPYQPSQLYIQMVSAFLFHRVKP